MYIDRHEHEDAVAYHKQFVTHFLMSYAFQMYTWDNDGVETKPTGFKLPDCSQPFQLITVTHNELSFL